MRRTISRIGMYRLLPAHLALTRGPRLCVFEYKGKVLVMLLEQFQDEQCLMIGRTRCSGGKFSCRKIMFFASSYWVRPLSLLRSISRMLVSL